MKDFEKWEGLFCTKPTIITELDKYLDVDVSIKRDELNHQIVQGNKLRKLKYNMRYAIENNKSCVATFGGAWSNHIVATAQATSLCGLKSIGFIRGDELAETPQLWSKTLNQAKEYGMDLFFLSRKEYRLKHKSNDVVKLLSETNKDIYIVPEGGSNSFAIQGITEIVSELQQQINEPTHIITACGTGGTMAGLINGIFKAQWNTKIIGIPVLKNGMFLKNEILKLTNGNNSNWDIYDSYHFGGYAKTNPELSRFGKNFVKKNNIDLDKVYTSKAFYAAYDLIKKGIIPSKSHVLILHTGGMQGGSITNGG